MGHAMGHTVSRRYPAGCYASSGATRSETRGWSVKKDKTKWLVFDDETVAEFPADRIKELHGGGDFHMAYMCFYRKMDGLTLD